MRFITVIIISLLLLGSLFAQNQDEIILSKLGIEGNTTTNTDVIKFTSGLKIGSVIKAGDFSRAVKQLWQSNLFDDVQIYGTESGADSILITIQVIEAPVLESIKISGNKKIRNQRLKMHSDFAPDKEFPNIYWKQVVIVSKNCMKKMDTCLLK